MADDTICMKNHHTCSGLMKVHADSGGHGVFTEWLMTLSAWNMTIHVTNSQVSVIMVAVAMH